VSMFRVLWLHQDYTDK